MNPKYVTEEDKKKYSDFFSHHITQIARHKAASKLCHYTSGDTLIKIIDSASIWATQIACLNDSKEMVYAIETFLEKIDEQKKSGGIHKRFVPCIDRIQQRLQNPSIETVGVFVSCFSSKLDDLSQWRAYGGSAGYALVFETDKLAFSAALHSDLVVPVLYGREEANILFDDAITWGQRFFLDGLRDQRAPTEEEWIIDFIDYWLWNLAFYAPMIKHESFRPEEEWRLIHHSRDGDEKREKFLQRSSMMTVHLPISLRATEDDKSGLLPLSAVIVGPTGNKRMSQVAIGDLLRSKGYDPSVRIEVTNLPYRPYL